MRTNKRTILLMLSKLDNSPTNIVFYPHFSFSQLIKLKSLHTKPSNTYTELCMRYWFSMGFSFFHTFDVMRLRRYLRKQINRTGTLELDSVFISVLQHRNLLFYSHGAKTSNYPAMEQINKMNQSHSDLEAIQMRSI